VVYVCCVIKESEGNIPGASRNVKHFPAFRRECGWGGAGVDAPDEVISDVMVSDA